MSWDHFWRIIAQVGIVLLILFIVSAAVIAVVEIIRKGFK